VGPGTFGWPGLRAWVDSGPLRDFAGACARIKRVRRELGSAH